MLDLTKVKTSYELKWFDGEVLHFPMPTQELLMEVMKLEGVEDLEEQFEGLNAIIRQILQSNREGKEFTEEDFALLDLSTISIILEDYMNSINQQLGE